MRTICEKEISNAVKDMLIDINYKLSDDVCKKICDAQKSERNSLAKKVICTMQSNLDAAKETGVPICQDTGMAVVFAEVGMDVKIESDKSFDEIINEGVHQAYLYGHLRLSVVGDPLQRVNTNDNTPCVLYTSLVKGDKIKLTVAPKGFGSENMSKIKMFTPSASRDDIIAFIVDTVQNAGSNPCPPVVVGVGIGGTFDWAAHLSKKALTRSLDSENSNLFYAEMEKETLDKINALGIGPQGFGGDTTALKVNIEYYPTHIAGLPVAVNINCHVCRHKSCTI